MMTFAEALCYAREQGVDPLAWGAATIDEGIDFVARTRRACVESLGMCTKYTRERTGKTGSIYRYESEGGTVGYVGAVASLLTEGFRLNV